MYNHKTKLQLQTRFQLLINVTTIPELRLYLRNECMSGWHGIINSKSIITYHGCWHYENHCFSNNVYENNINCKKTKLNYYERQTSQNPNSCARYIKNAIVSKQ